LSLIKKDNAISKIKKINDKEIDKAFKKAKSGDLLSLPGQNPMNKQGLKNIKITTISDASKQTDQIAYQVDMKFTKIRGHSKGIQVRYHSANPKSPKGTYSSKKPTVQINTNAKKGVHKYRLRNGRWVELKPWKKGDQKLIQNAHYKAP